MQEEGATYDLSNPWYEPPSDGLTMELSLFGQVHTALDDLVTDRAVAFCNGKDILPANMTDAGQVQVGFMAAARSVLLPCLGDKDGAFAQMKSSGL